VATSATNASTSTSASIINRDSYYATYESTGISGHVFTAKYPGSLGNGLIVSICDSDGWTSWAYKSLFDSAPGQSSAAAEYNVTKDELHVVVVDGKGTFSGQSGTVLEKFAFVSKASNARRSDGSNNFYKDVINTQSKYIWWTGYPTSGIDANQAWGQTFQQVVDAAGADVFAAMTSPGITFTLANGNNGTNPTEGQIQTAYALYANTELYDISLVITGKVTAATAKYVIDNVAEVRKDCMVFVSPVDASTGAMITGAAIATDTVAFRNSVNFNVNSSYAVLDSGFKYQYDRYNDKYRWVPLNGDIAGLCARTDYTNDAWWSPGGLNRGQIKNVVKLSFNPNKAERDTLYKAGINPVVSFPGQGTVLFGDKTLLTKPSAFDRINVRRLFIVLEKAIATAAKFQLFEFNDDMTRAQFRSMIEPFLRDVQGRRGVVDFRVVCDATNNTGEVIDRNEFVADIYIKPARSINFITLNFVAVRSGISFNEIA